MLIASFPFFGTVLPKFAGAHHFLSKMHHTLDSRPWIVAVTVVFLSFGVAVVVLAVLLVQNRRWRSRRKYIFFSFLVLR